MHWITLQDAIVYPGTGLSYLRFLSMESRQLLLCPDVSLLSQCSKQKHVPSTIDGDSRIRV